MRKEKNNEKILLLRNWKKNLWNINWKSNEEIIEEMKLILDKTIKNYSTDIIVLWPDWDRNYALTMKKIEEYDDNKQLHANAIITAIEKNKENWRIIAKTLSDSEFK
jgi:hypothetical protein